MRFSNPASNEVEAGDVPIDNILWAVELETGDESDWLFQYMGDGHYEMGRVRYSGYWEYIPIINSNSNEKLKIPILVALTPLSEGHVKFIKKI